MIKPSEAFPNPRASPAALEKKRCLGGVTCQGKLQGTQQEKHAQTSLLCQNNRGMWLCRRLSTETQQPWRTGLNPARWNNTMCKPGTILPWKEGPRLDGAWRDLD